MRTITIHVDFSPEGGYYWLPAVSGRPWLGGGWPCRTMPRLKNVATMTSPTSSSKQSPRRSGPEPVGSPVLTYQAPFHRCSRRNHRQPHYPPFKRKDDPTIASSSSCSAR